jgi:hypothetical protein
LFADVSQFTTASKLLAVGDITSGYFSVTSYYSGCSGSKQEQFFALGICMLDTDGSYSMLTGSVLSSTKNQLYQNFYTDDACTTESGLHYTFTLDSTCSSDNYITTFTNSISAPSGKSVLVA